MIIDQGVPEKNLQNFFKKTEITLLCTTQTLYYRRNNEAHMAHHVLISHVVASVQSPLPKWLQAHHVDYKTVVVDINNNNSLFIHSN